MALSGSATSGGGGSIFADSGSVPSPDLSFDFLESLRDEVLSGGFPDFVAGPNPTAPLSRAFASDDLVLDFSETEGGVLEDFVLDDFVSVDFGLVESFRGDCARDRILVAGFFVADLAFAMPDNGSEISGFPPNLSQA
jgi:hypothetical protein